MLAGWFLLSVYTRRCTSPLCWYFIGPSMNECVAVLLSVFANVSSSCSRIFSVYLCFVMVNISMSCCLVSCVGLDPATKRLCTYLGLIVCCAARSNCLVSCGRCVDTIFISYHCVVVYIILNNATTIVVV